MNDIINTAALQHASVQDWIMFSAWVAVTAAIVTQWDNIRRRDHENFPGRLTRYVMNAAILVGWLLFTWKTFGIQEIPGVSEAWAWLDTVRFKDPR